MAIEMKRKRAKYLTIGKVQQEFERIPKYKKIDILYSALDLMKQYNGRSKWQCIAMSMGYHPVEHNIYVKGIDENGQPTV